MESISLSTRCEDSLVHELTYGGIESALTSMTLRHCGIAPLASILQECPHITKLNYTVVLYNFNPFSAGALGIALGHASSLENLNIRFELTRPKEPRWLLQNIGTLKSLAQL
jgi:hypothetical protein